MRGGRVAPAVTVAVLTAASATGCGHGSPRGLVVTGTPPASPYAGPLYLPTRNTGGTGPGPLRPASGTAGRPLECDAEIFDGSGPDAWSAADGGDTPEEGLAHYFDMVQPQEPARGYRVEARSADRVPHSFDEAGRAKVAVVVARDQKDRPGRGPETDASCDPAELPARYAAAWGWEVWTDGRGGRLPVARISGSAGSAHCDRQSVRLLRLDGRTYARDPEGVLGRDGLLRAPYRGDARMPATAHDTGYHHGDRRLWLTDDPDTVYVRTSHGVEAWPRTREAAGCD
ncbi:hypothetical protein ACIQVT_04360 [Streptomyces sp. NPDC100445]|uniref:hypothetical protein n=1 Tax=Streptomyces sp. NPDC100445 TaxID=3366102 RepID=UPI0037F38009